VQDGIKSLENGRLKILQFTLIVKEDNGLLPIQRECNPAPSPATRITKGVGRVVAYVVNNK